MAEESPRNVSVLSSRGARWGIVVLGIALVWGLFPPFRIVPLDEQGRLVRGLEEQEAFDADGYALTFWTVTLAEESERATPLDTLLESLSKGLDAARSDHGVGGEDGGVAYFFAKGEGVVLELKGRRATLQAGEHILSLLVAPPVFGNTVRDGTGLLNVNEFPGLEEFNAVSSAFNQKVEREVMPSLAESLNVGTRLSFVGCAKVPSQLGDGPVLEFTPLRVEVIE